MPPNSQQPQPPLQQTDQQPQVQYVVSQQSLEGLDGGLALWLVLFALTGIGFISAFFGALQHTDGSAGNIALLVFAIPLAVLGILSTTLIALRKKVAKWVSIATISVSALYFSLNILISTIDSPNVEYAIVAGSVLTTLIIHGFGILYFCISKRVQHNLVR